MGVKQFVTLVPLVLLRVSSVFSPYEIHLSFVAESLHHAATKHASTATNSYEQLQTATVVRNILDNSSSYSDTFASSIASTPLYIYILLVE